MPLELPDEVLSIVLEYLCYTVDDWCLGRLLCKSAYKWCKERFFQDFTPVIGARSFIQVKRCVSCDQLFEYDLKCFRKQWNTPPLGPPTLYLCCKNFDCCRSVIRTLLTNAEEYGISILLKEAVLSKYGQCKRSSGSLGDCIFERGWLWRHSNAVRCYVGNWMVKDVPIHLVPKKYTQEYKVLTFNTV